MKGLEEVGCLGEDQYPKGCLRTSGQQQLPKRLEPRLQSLQYTARSWLAVSSTAHPRTWAEMSNLQLLGEQAASKNGSITRTGSSTPRNTQKRH